jgi:membrane protease YdiL (CAAX protease family)
VKLPDGWPFLVAVLAFVLWHYFLSATALRSMSQKWQRPIDAWAGPLSRVLGGFILLLVSITSAWSAQLPLDWFSPLQNPGVAFWVLAPALILIPLVWRAGRRPEQQARYPDFRVPNATRRQQLLSAGSWMVYLTGYEALFRGLILGLCTQAAGIGTGIAIHTALYVLAHLHKDAAETLGCIPMGYLFAFMTLQTGCLWPALLLHAAIAISAEQSAARANPSLAWQ